MQQSLHGIHTELTEKLTRISDAEKKINSDPKFTQLREESVRLDGQFQALNRVYEARSAFCAEATREMELLDNGISEQKNEMANEKNRISDNGSVSQVRRAIVSLKTESMGLELKLGITHRYLSRHREAQATRKFKESLKRTG